MCEHHAQLATDLLNWYDLHAREMPWRVGPVERRDGILPDPYHVWISEVMLQQTTVAAVKGYFARFVSKWPTVHDLAQAPAGDVMAAWAGLGYYARARNLQKCATVVAHHLDGEFPRTEEALLKLPGIGPYTAAAIAAIAFDRRAVVLDGNVERVMARYYRIEHPLPGAKKDLYLLAGQVTPEQRCADYAQAVMDLGATVCTPRSPACEVCPWRAGCAARKAGDAVTFPRRAKRVAKPVRLGAVFVAVRTDGALLLERRAPAGLLGGMLGWPGSDWGQGPVDAVPPVKGNWQEIGEVHHVFTHFHLRLQVYLAGDVIGDTGSDVINGVARNVANDTDGDTGTDMGSNTDADVIKPPSIAVFLPRSDFSPADLPTVMRKVWELCCAQNNIGTSRLNDAPDFGSPSN